MEKTFLPLNHRVFEMISGIAEEEHLECYVIGGYVRDLLLGHPSDDIDIVVVGSGIQLARKLARKMGGRVPVSVFRNFGTAMLRFDDLEIEFVGARKESYDRNSRKPVVEDGTLMDDLHRRDFTVNSLALSLNSENYGLLLDPFGGVDDLNNKIIRTPLNPDITYSDDPLRMIEAIRFATRLGFTIEEGSLQAIHRNAESLI
jgi:tRNA nucleotidyltransferase/poly(A) polymerase